MKSICLRTYVLTFFALLAFVGTQAQTCPMVFSPVTGKNNVTYLNACFAEAANENFYTEGVAFGSCIDAALMSPNTVCGTNYAPVVGCNGAIYLNACEAQKHGVTSFLPESSMVDDQRQIDDCFDYQIVANAFPGAFNYTNGTLTVNCPSPSLPVCGCNGIDYSSACEAEASGVVDYTYGACGNQNPDQCIDEDMVLSMEPTNCSLVYRPVCGCNDMTYINECAAVNSGVMRTISGTCGDFPWRNNATTLLFGETIDGNTSGSSNLVSRYNNCTTTPLIGPEDIYVIHKTEPGDLQVYLEIQDPTVDLDLFVVDGMSTGFCVGQSIRPVGRLQEGVVVNDAPIGTYYIIVDAQYANSSGAYTLQTGSGYLDTKQAVEIDCGVPMATSNVTGNNNMLGFNCSSRAEISGPEMIYTFSIINDAVVAIDLFNMTADMNMYLLNQLDLQNCVGSSETLGMGAERISLPLSAGTYYIVVDGGNGAMGDYMLNVNCNNSQCDQNLAVTGIDTDCNTASGVVSIQNLGSSNSQYVFSLEGPVTRCAADYEGEEIFENLPVGKYTVHSMDTYGCNQKDEITIAAGAQAFYADFKTSHNGGVNGGQIDFTMTGGFPPFEIYLNNTLHGTTSDYTYTISDLREGNYDVKVMDASSCEQGKIAAITNPCSLYTTLVPMDEDCGGLGSISIDVYNGTPPFTITLNGVAAAGNPYAATWIGINDLSAGLYTVVLTDANGCSDTQTTTINYAVNNITLVTTPSPQTCAGLGSIGVVASGGVGPYTVTLDGAPAGTYPGPNFTISNVTAGGHTLVVTDSYSCTETTSVTVGGSTAGVSIVSATPTAATCTSLGSAVLVVTGGTAPYVVTANGITVGTYNTTSFTLSGLTSGINNIVVTDANSCIDNTSITVGASTGGVSIVTATPTAVSCTASGSIAIGLSGGTAPYAVTMNGTAVTGSPFTTFSFTISGLATGSFAIVVTDASGCSDMTNVTVGGSTTGVSIVSATPTAVSCSSAGSAAIVVTGGTAPYVVTTGGLAAGTYTTSSFTLTGLAAGTHNIVVTDANGCSDNTSITIAGSGGGVSIVTATPTAASCSSTGSIAVDVTGGTAPYAVTLDGTAAAGSPFATTWFNLTGLAAGTYTIVVTDANGCSDTMPVTVGNNGGNITLIATPSPAVCNGGTGSISIAATGGVAPFSITVNGTPMGTTSNNPYTVNNVPAGTYTISIVDANGCTGTTTSTVTGGTGGVTILTATPTAGSCSAPGSIAVDVSGGTAPYSVTLNGTSAGTYNNTWFAVPAAPGTYTMVVTDANGCSDTTTVIVGGTGGNITLTATPSPAGCNGGNGSISVAVAGGAAPFAVSINGTYVSSTSNNPFNIINTPSGTYTITVVDANGCTGTTTSTVTGGGSGGVTILTATPTSGSCSTSGSIGVDVTGGTAPYSVTLNGTPAGTYNATWFAVPAAPGTYTMVVTDANGCSDTTTVTVGGTGGNITLIPTPSPAGCNGGYGSISISVVGGAAPFAVSINGTYVSSTNNNPFNIINVPAGTYTISIVDANGCTGTTTSTVTGGSGGVTILTATPTAGSCSASGSIGVDVSGGTAPYSVTLNGAAAGTYNNTWFAVPAAPGTYTMVVTDANGCSDTTTVTVGGSGSGLTLTPTSTTPACGGYGSITIAVNGGVAPFAVSVNGSYISSTNNNPFNIVNVTSGTYTISVTDANGCTGVTTATVAGGGSTKLIATGTASPASCSGSGKIQLDITGGSSSFDVYLDGTFKTNTNNRWYIISNVTAGSHTVRVVDANGCEDTFTITVSGGGGSLSVTATPSVNGCGYGIIGVDVQGGTPPYDVTLNGNHAGSSTQTWFNILGVASGSYTLVVTDANGCTGTTQVVVPTSTGSGIVLTATATSGSCNSSSTIQMDYTGGTAPFEIFLDGTFINTTNNQWYSIPNVSSGTHVVKVVDKFGCEDTYTVTVGSAGGRLTLGATSTPGSCSIGGMIKLDINGGTPPFTVDLNGVFAVTTSDRWYTLTNIIPGGYDILVTDANGCTATHVEVVGNTGGTNLTLTATTTTGTCAVGGDVQLDINGGAGPFDVELDGVFVTNTNDRWFTITNVAAGNRVITVTDKSGCSVNYTVTVQTPVSNLFIATTATNATCRNKGSIFFDINGGVGPWDIEVNGVYNTSTPNRWHTIDNLLPNIYEIKITGPTGCVAIKQDTVEIDDDLFLYTSATNATCGGKGSIFFDINGGVGPWDVLVNGAYETTTSNRWHDLPDLAPGIYDIEIVGPNGCRGFRSDTVDVDDDLTLWTDVTDASCGGSNGIIFFDINGGVGPWDLYVNGVYHSRNTNRWLELTDLLPGTYELRLEGANGCTATNTSVVGVDSGIDFNATVIACGCGLNNGRIELDITGGVAPFDIFLNGVLEYNNVNNRFPIFRDLAPGNYTVRVVDKLGCESSETYEVDDSSPANFTVSANDATCGQNNGSIDLDITSGVAPYEIFLDGNVVGTANGGTYMITNLASGNYEVGVRDSKGCESVNNAKVRGGVAMSLQTNSVNGNCAATGSINLTITGGTAPFDISLDGNLVTNTSDRNYQISGLANGSYTVNVVDSESCDVSATQNVSVVTSNIAINSSATATGCGLTNGSISVTMTGGTAPYDVYLDGVLIGTTFSNNFTAGGLAEGTYDIRIEDANSCEKSIQETIGSSGGISVSSSVTAGGCSGITGSVTVNINSGVGPFDIYLNGALLGTTNITTYTASGLASGTYTLEIKDANNCSGTVTETVTQSTNLSFNATKVDAGCGTTNGSITVTDIVGTPPYTIFLNGSSIASTSDNTFNITGLAGGSYVVGVSDANACDASQSLVLAGSGSNVTLSATTFPENCDARDGNITLDIQGGVGPFEVYMDGVLLATTNDRWYNIMDLTVGTYAVRVVDANGCEARGSFTVAGNTAINVATTSTSGSCGSMTGTITVDATGGLAPYTIYLNGTNQGTTFNQFFTVAGVAPGTYNVRVVDANGCEKTVQETVGGASSFAVTATGTDISCGTLGSILVTIQTGAAPYDIYVNGNPAGSTADNTFNISNLNTGDYDVRIVDANGCEDTKKLTIGGSNALSINAIAQPDNCGDNGAALIEFLNGVAPYTIDLDGVNIATATGFDYLITNLVSGGYVVKVTDANGCTEEMVVMINNTGMAPNAVFTYIFTPGGIVKFFSNNPGGTVAWDFDDGSTSTEVNPIHAFAVGNTYKVCLTATNNCGTAEHCETLIVPTVYSSNLSFTAGTVSGRPGETIAIPVEVDNFDRVMSFQYTVQLDNQTVGKIVDVTTDDMNDMTFDIMSDDMVTLHWESNDANGMSLPNDHTIFNVIVELTGTRGNCANVEFPTFPMNIEVRQRWFNDPTLVIPNFFDGEICVNNMVNISGKIVREDNESIPNVEVSCNSSQTMINDANTGEYEFSGSQLGSSCLILPTKDGDDNMGLSVMDLIKMRRHIMDVSPMNSPYKIIAADVNRDKEIDGNDLGIVGDLILGNQDQMFQGDSWRFLPAGWSFTDPEEPFAPLFPVMINLMNLTGDMYDQDFMGMKLGDVDNSLDMPTMTDNMNMNGQLTFHTSDLTVAQGDDFVLEITSSDFSNVCGFQLELNYDPARFEFVEMLAGELSGLPHNMVGRAATNDGVLTVLWYDKDLASSGISHKSDEVLYRLKFTATQGFNSLAGLFEIGQVMTHSVGVNIGNQYLDIDFNIEGATSSVGEKEEAVFAVDQNHPNPFGEETYIGFTLPSPQVVDFELVDQQGRIIKRTQQFYNKGYQQITVKGDDLSTSGIYFYRLSVADKTVAKKLIFMKKK